MESPEEGGGESCMQVATRCSYACQPSPNLPPALASLLTSPPGAAVPKCTSVVFAGPLNLVHASSGGALRWVKKPDSKSGTRAVTAVLMDGSVLLLTEAADADGALVVGDVIDLRKAVLHLPSRPGETSLELRTPEDSVFLQAVSTEAFKTWVGHLSTALWGAAKDDVKALPGWQHRQVQGTLWSAALLGHRRTLARLLGTQESKDGEESKDREATGVDVDSKDELGRTALTLAVIGGRMDCVAHLLDAGANTNLGDEGGVTPLSYAAQGGHADMVAFLMGNHADPDVASASGSTALHAAMRCTDAIAMTKVTRLLLGEAGIPGVKGGNPATSLRSRVNAQDAAGATPLHVLVHTARQLEGAVVDVAATAAVLLLAGAQASTHAGPDGWTPLHTACGADGEAGNVVDAPFVAALLQGGASPNAVSGRTNETAMHVLLRAAQGEPALAATGDAAEGDTGSEASPRHENPLATPKPPADVVPLYALAIELSAAGARLDVPDSVGVTPKHLLERLGDTPAGSSTTTAVVNAVQTYSGLGATRVPDGQRDTTCPKDMWVPDKDAPQCAVCMTPFSKTRRRHHCRYCGEVVCAQCSAHEALLAPDPAMVSRASFMGSPSTTPSAQRVCDCCFNRLKNAAALVVASTATDAEAGTPAPPTPRMGANGSKPLTVTVYEARDLIVTGGGLRGSSDEVTAVVRIGLQTERVSATGGSPPSPQFTGEAVVFGAMSEEDAEDSDGDEEVAESVATALQVELEVWLGNRPVGAASLPLGFVRTAGTSHAINGWRPLRLRGKNAGEVRVRVAEVGDEEAADAPNTPEGDEPASSPLTVWILQGRQLRAADFDGTSDPYAVVTVGKETFKTKVVRSTLNPRWEGATYTFGQDPLSRVDYVAATSLHIALWDKDVLSADDPLGDVSIDLHHTKGHHGAAVEEWHDVTWEGKPCGELLVRLQEVAATPPPPPAVADAVEVDDVDLAVPPSQPAATGVGAAQGASAAAAAAVAERGEKVDQLESGAARLGSASKSYEDNISAVKEEAAKPPKSCCAVM